MKFRPVGAELFVTDRQTDRHEEANNHVFAVLRTRLKMAGTWHFGAQLALSGGINL